MLWLFGFAHLPVRSMSYGNLSFTFFPSFFIVALIQSFSSWWNDHHQYPDTFQVDYIEEVLCLMIFFTFSTGVTFVMCSNESVSHTHTHANRRKVSVIGANHSCPMSPSINKHTLIYGTDCIVIVSDDIWVRYPRG